MNAKRTHFLLIGLFVVLVGGLVGGAYEVNGFLGTRATKLADLKLQEQQLESQQTGLKKAKQDVTTYGALSNITKQIVPQDKDQAQTVREIVNIAASAGVHITTIAFPQSTLGTAPAAKPGAAPVSGAATPSAAISSKSALSQLVAVPNIPGVYLLQITVSNDPDTEVTYPQLYNFLSGLENNRRTALVSDIVINPDAANRNLLEFTLTLNEYIKPS
jgi:hypothetical protein